MSVKAKFKNPFDKGWKKSAKMKMKCLLLIMLVLASDENENALENDTESGKRNEPEQSVVVKIEEDEYVKVNKGVNYIGVSYNITKSRWFAQRHSKEKKKNVYNGQSYKDEETAAHASDTLARKLIENGEKGHKLNFPDDDTEVFPEGRTSSFIGVTYSKKDGVWSAYRSSKNKHKTVFNGASYKNEETAAHASDTLARIFIANGEIGHKLNFPNDNTEVHTNERTSNFIGVSYSKKDGVWSANRRSKNEHKTVFNGASYKNEETAAHASDTLARKLIANGEKSHKLNFPDDDTEVHPKEKTSNYIGVTKQVTWRSQRWSKIKKKSFSNGRYKDEERAARASDTLARKLIANGEKDHKLNFPDDDTEVHPEKATYQKKKRKRAENLGNSQDNKSYQN